MLPLVGAIDLDKESKMEHCPKCGRFLDRRGACTIVCAYGWRVTGDGFKVHPDDAVVIGVRDLPDGECLTLYDMKPKARRVHLVQLW